MLKVAPFFGTSSPFSSLSTTYTKRLQQEAKVLSLEDGEVLFEASAPCDGCYWLELGALKVIATSEEGEDQILELLGTGALVGMLDGLPRLVAVRALGDCRLVFISRTTFLECLSDSPKLKDYLLNKFIERLRQAGERAAVANLLSLKARPRLARALLELAQYSGEPAAHKDEIFIRHKIRHRELAALAGVTRETATRTLREWTESNIIRRRSAYYCVDRAALEAQAAIGDCAKAEPASEDRSTKSGRFGSDQQPVSLLI